MLFASLHALTVDMILISNVQTGILHLSVNCVLSFLSRICYS